MQQALGHVPQKRQKSQQAWFGLLAGRCLESCKPKVGARIVAYCTGQSWHWCGSQVERKLPQGALNLIQVMIEVFGATACATEALHHPPESLSLYILHIYLGNLDLRK